MNRQTEYSITHNYQTMNIIKQFALYPILMVLLCVSFSCKNQVKTEASKKGAESGEGDVTVAVYFYPNWGAYEESEWPLIHDAKPRFQGHQQPKVPLWGYTNENDPKFMAQKIDAAADHGVDAFIFDWYWYDTTHLSPGSLKYHWSGNKILHKALEEGFLKAPNKNRLKFSLMWANHNRGDILQGAVTLETWERMMDYVIENYFSQSNYWKIDGCPYFSIYQMFTFLEMFGNDYAKASEALDSFRDKVNAGFPGLHLNAVLWGLREDANKMIEEFGINSTTSYVWVHHNGLPDSPTTEYTKAAETYFHSVDSGGAYNGLDKPASEIAAPYHINVSMGWDASPRAGNVSDTEYSLRSGYGFGPVIANNTPELFKKYLLVAKEMTLMKPENERIITINSWNEWSEGSYLEPDTINGMAYLEAIKDVFGDK